MCVLASGSLDADVFVIVMFRMPNQLAILLE